MKNELEIKIDDEFAKKVYDEIWAEYKKTAQTKTFAKITLTEDELKITDSKVMGLPCSDRKKNSRNVRWK